MESQELLPKDVLEARIKNRVVVVNLRPDSDYPDPVSQVCSYACGRGLLRFLNTDILKHLLVVVTELGKDEFRERFSREWEQIHVGTSN
jgi:hypothetical protein